MKRIIKKYWMTIIPVILAFILYCLPTPKPANASRTYDYSLMASFATNELWLENRLNTIVALLEDIKYNTNK